MTSGESFPTPVRSNRGNLCSFKGHSGVQEEGALAVAPTKSSAGE